MNKYLHFIALLYMAVSHASCHTDEPVIIGNEDEVVEKESLQTYPSGCQ